VPGLRWSPPVCAGGGLRALRGPDAGSIHALNMTVALCGSRAGPDARRAIAQLAKDAPGEMLVVPVPLHRSKYAERGFNQARSLAVHALDALAIASACGSRWPRAR